MEHRLAQDIFISVSIAYLLYNASMDIPVRLGPCHGVKYGKWQHLPLRVFMLKKINPKILQTCCIYVNASDTKQKFINVLCCSDYTIIYYTNIYCHSVRNLLYDLVYSLEQNKQINIYKFQQKLERESRRGTDLYSYKTVRSSKGRCLQREGLIEDLTIGVVFTPYYKFLTYKALKIPVSHVIKKNLN